VAKTIDWRYHRKGCTTCKKAEGFLEEHGCKVKETADASKDRKGPTEALAVLDGMSKLIVARGKKTVEIDLKKGRPEDAELLALLMGPTGNLRAPTMKVGKTVLVGYNEEAYAQVFGS
jgi:arsenate reductase-like glutaredoxin family protein